MDLIKHSAAVQITNNITLVQRKCWNALLYFARPHLEVEETHEVELTTLAKTVGYTSRNTKHLKGQLKAMTITPVEWNILGKDRTNAEVWNVNATLIADVSFSSNRCRYSYSPQMRLLLRNPNMYARLDMAVQSRFRVSHALPIWEFLIDSIGARRHHATVELPLEDFKALLHLKNKSYHAFKELNRAVIKPALEDINKASNLCAEVDPIKSGRQVTALRFRASKKPLFTETAAERTEVAGEPEPDYSNVKKKLRKAGLDDKAVEKLLNEHDLSYIEGNYRVVMAEARKGKVKNLQAYMMAAFRDDYRPKGGQPETSSEGEPDANAVYVPGAAEALKRFKRMSEEEQGGLLHTFRTQTEASIQIALDCGGVEDPHVHKHFAVFLVREFAKA